MGYKKSVKINLEKLKLTYDKCRKVTESFEKIDKKIMKEYPEILLIIRLANKLSQNKFAREINLKRSSLAHYELHLKNMSCEMANKILEKVKSCMLKGDFSFKKIAEYYKYFWEKAKFGQMSDSVRDMGRKAIKLRKPTIDEAEFEKILKSANIEYQREGLLNLDGMFFYFDFVIPNSNNPRIVVECKNIQIKDKRCFRVRCFNMSYEIGYRYRLIRDRYPHVKRILILKTKIKTFPERTNKIFKNEVDFTFLTLDRPKILFIIRKFV